MIEIVVLDRLGIFLETLIMVADIADQILQRVVLKDTLQASV